MTIIRYPTERSVRSPSFIIQDGIVYSPYNRVIEDDVEIDLYRQLRTLQLRDEIAQRNNKALHERYKRECLARPEAHLSSDTYWEHTASVAEAWRMRVKANKLAQTETA